MITRVAVEMETFDIEWSGHASTPSTPVVITGSLTAPWRIELAGWKALSFGYSQATAYLWSAREVVVLPTLTNAPSIFRVEDDILSAHLVGEQWVVICETSVRVLTNGNQVDCVELGEVVESFSVGRRVTIRYRSQWQ